MSCWLWAWGPSCAVGALPSSLMPIKRRNFACISPPWSLLNVVLFHKVDVAAPPLLLLVVPCCTKTSIRKTPTIFIYLPGQNHCKRGASRGNNFEKPVMHHSNFFHVKVVFQCNWHAFELVQKSYNVLATGNTFSFFVRVLISLFSYLPYHLPRVLFIPFLPVTWFFLKFWLVYNANCEHRDQHLHFTYLTSPALRTGYTIISLILIGFFLHLWALWLAVKHDSCAFSRTVYRLHKFSSNYGRIKTLFACTDYNNSSNITLLHTSVVFLPLHSSFLFCACTAYWCGLTTDGFK